MSVEVVNGREEGGEVSARLQDYLSCVVPSTGEVESEAIIHVDLQSIKN